jgi:Snf7
MMQSMKGATMLLGSMNRQMNLPALQRIAMEFERENDIMDQRQEMMDDAIDEVTGLEDEEESEDIVKEVLDEIGVDLSQAVCLTLRMPITAEGVLNYCLVSWEKHHRDYRKMQWARQKSPRPLAVGVLMTMTSRQGLIVSGDDVVRLVTSVLSVYNQVFGVSNWSI